MTASFEVVPGFFTTLPAGVGLITRRDTGVALGYSSPPGLRSGVLAAS